MIRSSRWTVAVALLASITTASHRAGAQAADAITDPEAYRVYAAALSLPTNSPEGPRTAISILASTRVAKQSCDLSGPWRPPDWAAVVDGYRRENARERLLQPGFDLNVPYTLLTRQDLKGLMDKSGYDLSRPANRPFANLTVLSKLPGRDLMALSAVGFNRERTRATVTVQSGCSPLTLLDERDPGQCGRGDQLFFEKVDGRWSIAPAGCSWSS
jgi:hypothetical protein